MRRKALFILAAIALLLVQPRPVSAASIFDVSFAAPDAGAPWSLYFQLTDGLGTGDGNNTVALSNFNFGAAVVANDPLAEGGASGSLGTGVSLTDSSFFNSFSQTVNGGGLFSFRMSLTSLLDAGGTPDTFAFSLFNDAGALPGSDEISGALLIASLTGGTPEFQTFGGLKVTAVPDTKPVPEPGTLVLLITGMAGAAVRRRFQRGTAAAA